MEPKAGIALNIPGYSHIRLGRIRMIATNGCLPVFQAMLEQGTLYEIAGRLPDARSLQGRAPVYVITLADCGPVVVRHSMRGGLVAKLTRDRYLLPAGGLRELVSSIRLRRAGIRTPEMLAFVTYPAGLGTRRADIVTRFVDGEDLAAVFRTSPDVARRRAIWDAVAELIGALARIGAHHQDLNLKNILIVQHPTHAEAYVLDVDRVRLNPPSPIVLEANLGRLRQSLEKWRAIHGLPIEDADLTYLSSRTRDAMP